MDDFSDPKNTSLQLDVAAVQPQGAPPRQRSEGDGYVSYAGVGVCTQLPQLGSRREIYIQGVIITLIILAHIIVC